MQPNEKQRKPGSADPLALLEKAVTPLEHHRRGNPCVVCQNTPTAWGCTECDRVYCDADCLCRGQWDHAKVCARMWASMDADVKQNQGQWFQIPPPEAVAHRICHGCYRVSKDTKTRRCGRCLRVRYCSQECQRRDWKAHHRSVCLSRKDTDPDTVLKEGAKVIKEQWGGQEPQVSVRILQWDLMRDGQVVEGGFKTQAEAEAARLRRIRETGQACVVKPLQVTSFTRPGRQPTPLDSALDQVWANLAEARREPRQPKENQ